MRRAVGAHSATDGVSQLAPNDVPKLERGNLLCTSFSGPRSQFAKSNPLFRNYPIVLFVPLYVSHAVNSKIGGMENYICVLRGWQIPAARYA